MAETHLTIRICIPGPTWSSQTPVIRIIKNGDDVLQKSISKFEPELQDSFTTIIETFCGEEEKNGNSQGVL